jgi:hypothetical protein
MRTTPPVSARPKSQGLEATSPVAHVPGTTPAQRPAASAGASTDVTPITSPNLGHRRIPVQRGASPRLLDEAKQKTADASKIIRLNNQTYSNKQSATVLDEFTALAMDGIPFHISIIKKDGSIVNQESLLLIQKRLMNREGQVLWTLNTNGDFVLGMKSGGTLPVKHAVLANADDHLANLLGQEWGDASLDLCSDWLPSRKNLLENQSACVISAGCVSAIRLSGNDFKILFDNESGHFEPNAKSLAHISMSSTFLSRLTNESFHIVDIGFKYYYPGSVA